MVVRCKSVKRIMVGALFLYYCPFCRQQRCCQSIHIYALLELAVLVDPPQRLVVADHVSSVHSRNSAKHTMDRVHVLVVDVVVMLVVEDVDVVVAGCGW